MDNYTMPSSPTPSPMTDTEVPLQAPYYGCSFTEAVKRFFTKYAVFKGRASRSEYWFVVLFLGIIDMVLFSLIEVTGDTGTPKTIVLSVNNVWGLFCIVPSIALSVRRLHDTGKSGGWWFVAFIPEFIGVIISVNGAAMDDPIPGVIVIGIGLIIMLVGLIINIVLMIQREKPEGALFDDPNFAMNSYGHPAQMPATGGAYQSRQSRPFGEQYPTAQPMPYQPQAQPMQPTAVPQPSEAYNNRPQAFAQQSNEPYIPLPNQQPGSSYGQPPTSTQQTGQWGQSQQQAANGQHQPSFVQQPVPQGNPMHNDNTTGDASQNGNVGIQIS
ncbi:DUF805 domain-containing protein [Bifidobacterium bombi]|uniref:DUF805 domain-containing protein n=1 Tax=Bifidobacterium bombi DSM 19703 TaxID=1341695 RepID=A0A080N3L1_9BIFI|nr:DUF805 domain-containing protein [Bifidobacterium bombi]KFF31606.1 hypothetical protein BBOMB_0991 [Bifidobacterium bombi DSM 19703]